MESEENQGGDVAIHTEHSDVVEAEEVVNNDIDNAGEDVANTEAVANLETVEKTVIGEEEYPRLYCYRVAITLT